MTSHTRQRLVRYALVDDHLVRTVASGGRTYVHRCDRASFEAVAHALAETPATGEGTTMERIARAERLAHTRVNVALEFCKDRGIVDVRHRRCYPAGGSDPYLDAMIEFTALAEQGHQQLTPPSKGT
ncbi:MAG TPA: hypothetical protein VGN72_10685 [Tepidisphaeraceae bacterium]|jgi:hypothetical protein|nr:hypothetical protein [Tepidisphaeraceae bacterium]